MAIKIKEGIIKSYIALTIGNILNDFDNKTR